MKSYKISNGLFLCLSLGDFLKFISKLRKIFLGGLFSHIF